MISLVPSWANRYAGYWDTIRKRNLWLIKLRYGAVAMFIAFLISSRLILDLSFNKTQFAALIFISIIIFIYNLLLYRLSKLIKTIPGHFNPLHFSLLQMLFDLSALGLIVYYTGSIETPLFMLFVFHIIIGSLILPGSVIYILAGLIVLIFNILIFSEYFSLIPHQSISGLLTNPLYTNIKFVAAYDVVFSFVMFVSVFLANKIASQLYRIEQQLIESLDKLSEAETEKQKYIIGIVHEIKTPLAAVHSYLDLVLQKFLGQLNGRVEERLNRARSRSGEAIEMINDVLKVSKLRLLDEIANDEVELCEVIAKLIKEQKINLRAKHIMINFFDGRTFKKNIKGDKFLLEIAFSNLIGNAVKYVGTNGLIELDLVDNQNEIEIEIADSGIGIPAEELDKIFTDFFRASNIKDRSYEGTGLGLSIVKQIIERHKGNITVESPSKLALPGRPGASFKLKLPYVN